MICLDASNYGKNYQILNETTIVLFFLIEKIIYSKFNKNLNNLLKIKIK